MDKQIDYNGLPYWIMEYCAHMQKIGKLTDSLYTDDFEYGDWQKILPEEWLDEARKAGDVIEMHYISGQGSDFWITLAKNTENLPLIIDWDEAVRLSKMKRFYQARWYFNDMYSRADKEQKTFLEKNKDKIFFLLGLAGSWHSFVERINLNNLYESLKWAGVM